MTSTVTCDRSEASWEVNSEGLDACQMYAGFEGICTPSFHVQPAVPSGPAYTHGDNECSCNILAYNLMAACAWCQSAVPLDWWLDQNQWSSLCHDVPYFSYASPSLPPVPLPANLSIPTWAYTIPTGLTWSPDQVQAVAEGHGSVDGPYAYLDVPPGMSVTTIVTIVCASVLGTYALMVVILVIVYFVRQRRRKAWYRPMGQYYAGLKSSGVTYPILNASNNNTPYEYSKAPSGAGDGYPPPERPSGDYVQSSSA